MLDEKHTQESASVVKQLIRDNQIVKPNPGTTDFFMNKSIISLQLSKRIMEISDDKTDPITAYFWVINTAYYSMFFAATALLAHFNHKINSNTGIHTLTYHALVYYFYINDNKLQEHFIEEYGESYNEAEQLLQITEKKAAEIIENFKFELAKRSKFTYDVGPVAEQSKAVISLKRADEFIFQVNKMIEK